ncbi:hypothetical protein D3C78_1706490 [compost metagenome]
MRKAGSVSLISRIETKAKAARMLAARPTSAWLSSSAWLGLATSSTPIRPMPVVSSMRRVSGSFSRHQAISGVNTGAE